MLKCNICSFKSDKEEMKRHIRNIHPNYEYPVTFVENDENDDSLFTILVIASSDSNDN